LSLSSSPSDDDDDEVASDVGLHAIERFECEAIKARAAVRVVDDSSDAMGDEDDGGVCDDDEAAWAWVDDEDEDEDGTVRGLADAAGRGGRGRARDGTAAFVTRAGFSAGRAALLATDNDDEAADGALAVAGRGRGWAAIGFETECAVDIGAAVAVGAVVLGNTEAVAEAVTGLRIGRFRAAAAMGAAVGRTRAADAISFAFAPKAPTAVTLAVAAAVVLCAAAVDGGAVTGRAAFMRASAATGKVTDVVVVVLFAALNTAARLVDDLIGWTLFTGLTTPECTLVLVAAMLAEVGSDVGSAVDRGSGGSGGAGVDSQTLMVWVLSDGADAANATASSASPTRSSQS
jgi:hypothetical protein